LTVKEPLRVGDYVRYIGPSVLVFALEDLRKVVLEPGMTGRVVDRRGLKWVVEFANAYTAEGMDHLERWEPRRATWRR
jgi:hypothetical protein